MRKEASERPCRRLPGRLFRSPASGTDNTEGLLKAPDTLTITAESDLVVFGDGMESDTLTISWGQRLEIGVAPVKLHLVV